MTFRPGTDSATRAQAIANISGTVIGGLRDDDGSDGFYFVHIPGDSSGSMEPVFVAVDTLGTMPGVELPLPVEYSAADAAYRKPVESGRWSQWQPDPSRVDTTNPNWALQAVSAPMAWGCSTGDPAVRIAVLDNGITTGANIGRNVTYIDSLPQPSSRGGIFHGYSVASVLGAVGNDSAGSTGLMWRVGLDLEDLAGDPNNPGQWLAGSFLNMNRDSALFLLNSSHIINAGRRGARVIVLSRAIDWRGEGHTPSATSKDDLRLVRDRQRTVLRAINRLRNAGLQPLFVISAGNDALDARWAGYAAARDSFPDQVLVVGGTDKTGQVWRTTTGGSNVGPLVEVMAPSVGVGSFSRSGDAESLQGTSFAAPLVSGIAGLLLSFDPGRAWTASDLKHLIIAGAQAGGRSAGGIPVANAYWSLRSAAQRPGAPLCGNQVWVQNSTVYASRGDLSAPSSEALGSVTATLPQNAVVAVEHGGRQIGACVDQGTRDPLSAPTPLTVVPTCTGLLTYGGGQWGASTQPSYVTSSGSARSAFGLSHGADTLVWEGAYTSTTSPAPPGDPGSIHISRTPAVNNTSGNPELLTTLSVVSSSGSCQPSQSSAPGGFSARPNFSVGGNCPRALLQAMAYSPLGDQIVIATTTTVPTAIGTQFWALRADAPAGGSSTAGRILRPFPSNLAVQGLSISEDGAWLTAAVSDMAAGTCALQTWSLVSQQMSGAAVPTTCGPRVAGGFAPQRNARRRGAG